MMSGVSIEYKGSTIATIEDTGSKTLKTQGMYCEGDIFVEYETPPAPSPTLITKNISANGTYSASSDNADGYSQVVVAVSGIPIDDESLTPLEFGCDAGGFFFSDTTGSGTGFALGRDNTGIYAEATT